MPVNDLKLEASPKKGSDEILENINKLSTYLNNLRKKSNFEAYRIPTGTEKRLEDISEAEKWFNERFAYLGIPFHRVEHLIDGHAHGQFREAAVYIYENAELGTTYHEAFHVVSQIFLTRKEREALYKEYVERNPQYENRSEFYVRFMHKGE